MRLNLIVAIALVAGCSTGLAVQESESALSPVISDIYPLVTFPGGFEMVGISGDERLLFTGVITPSATQPKGVFAAARLSGNPVGALPPPPVGWEAPTEVLVVSYSTTLFGTTGTLLVVDNGAVPPNAHSTVYKYVYSYSRSAGFSATLTETHNLPVLTNPPPGPINGFGYVSGIVALTDGTIVMTDALIGGIWTCSSALNDCQLGIIDADFGFGPAPTFQGVGRAPGGGTRPYSFTLTNGILPGILGVTYSSVTDEICTARTAQPGGIYCVELSVLLDTTTPPFAKTKRVVVPPQIGLSDGGHGVQVDKYHPTSPWLYWVRSLSDTAGGGFNTVRRVNLLTGAIQVVAKSNALFDFSTGLTVLPPLVAGSPFGTFATAMGQEYNNSSFNADLGGVDQYVAPTFITGIKVVNP